MPYAKEERKKIFIPGKYDALCRSIAENAVTLIRNRNQLLPIQEIKNKKVCVINAFSPENKVLISQGQFPIPEIIVQTLHQKGAQVESFEMTSDLDQNTVRQVALNTANQ